MNTGSRPIGWVFSPSKEVYFTSQQPPTLDLWTPVWRHPIEIPKLTPEEIDSALPDWAYLELTDDIRQCIARDVEAAIRKKLNLET